MIKIGAEISRGSSAIVVFYRNFNILGIGSEMSGVGNVQGRKCPGSEVSEGRKCPGVGSVQGRKCPGSEVSGVGNVQGLKCPGVGNVRV